MLVQDRIKEWGKRYLQIIGKPLGVQFPDRRISVRTHEGKARRLTRTARLCGPDNLRGQFWTLLSDWVRRSRLLMAGGDTDTGGGSGD